MTSLRAFILTVVLIGVFPTNTLGQRVIYVDTHATGTNTGSSWINAFVFLQDALAIAAHGDEIWVAEGVYRPDQGSGVTSADRDASFVVTTGISIFGGFEGTEDSRPVSDWKAHPAVLSGDLQGNDNAQVHVDESSRLDNSCHVVRMDSVPGTVVMEGVQVVGGNADESCTPPHTGGGIRATTSSIHLRNVLIARNASQGAGGGVYQTGGNRGFPGGFQGYGVEILDNYSKEQDGGGVYASTTFLDIRDSVFRRNRSGFAGNAGGLYASDGHVRLINVLFEANSLGAQVEHATLTMIGCGFVGDREWYAAGVVLSEFSTGLIVNSVFSRNEAGPAAINVAEESHLDLVNSTVFTNSVASLRSAPIFCNGCTLRISNSILWGSDDSGPQIGSLHPASIVVGNSVVRGGLPVEAVDSGGNYDADPMFDDPLGSDGLAGTADDQFGLRSGSPAIDHGDVSALPPDSLDIDHDGDLEESLPTDREGATRVEGSAIDVGAFEFAGIVNSAEGFLPSRDALAASAPFPNPFTRFVSLDLSSVATGRVFVRVLDILGREVARLDHGTFSPGSRRLTWDASGLADGTYFIVVSAGGRVQTLPVVLMK